MRKDDDMYHEDMISWLEPILNGKGEMEHTLVKENWSC